MVKINNIWPVINKTATMQNSVLLLTNTGWIQRKSSKIRKKK